MLMTSKATLAEAAAELRPLYQGELDGLCGLYAIINAVRLVVYPARRLRPWELRQLFATGLATLASARRLRPTLSRGIPHRLWSKLCDSIIADAQALTGLELYAEQLFGSDDPVCAVQAVRRIKRQVRAGSPVLLALMDRYDHTSVVVGFSRTRLTLFDSAGHRWVWMRSLSFDAGQPGVPHYVPPSSVVALLAV